MPKVFFFDDDESNLRIYNKYFDDRFIGKGIQNPHHYKEALVDDVSAILIDVIMPIMSGIELYDIIKSDPHYNGCPIIFISGSSSEEAKLNAINIGAQDFLTRMFSKSNSSRLRWIFNRCCDQSVLGSLVPRWCARWYLLKHIHA